VYIEYCHNAIIVLQAATMYHDATIGNAINIVLVRIIYLEQDEVGLRVPVYTVYYVLIAICCTHFFRYSSSVINSLLAKLLNRMHVCSACNLSSRAFRHSATAIWNNLPAVIRSANSLYVFKRRLKTHLFSVAFNTEL